MNTQLPFQIGSTRSPATVSTINSMLYFNDDSSNMRSNFFVAGDWSNAADHLHTFTPDVFTAGDVMKYTVWHRHTNGPVANSSIQMKLYLVGATSGNVVVFDTSAVGVLAPLPAIVLNQQAIYRSEFIISLHTLTSIRCCMTLSRHQSTQVTTLFTFDNQGTTIADLSLENHYFDVNFHFPTATPPTMVQKLTMFERIRDAISV